MLFVKVGFHSLDCVFLTNLANLNYKKKTRCNSDFKPVFIP
jgi:hypothetical protein